MLKPYRINVVALYYEGTNVNQFRQPVFNLLTGFAWLYHLEYAISVKHDFNLPSGEADLIYFRSTDQTKISKKDLNALISDVFRNGFLIFRGVEVFCQMYKFLPQYPFPSVYDKPLNYPYVECHNGNESKLYIYKEALDKIIEEDEQNQNIYFS